MTKRRGISLVELMIVLTVTSALMTVSIGWIVQSMKLSKQMQARQMHQQNLTRLTRDLRGDVHAAESATVDDGQFTLPGDDSVTYQIDGPTLMRKTSQRTETYSLARGTTCRWDDSELPTAITLIVNRSSGSPIPSRSENAWTDTTDKEDLRLRVELNRYERLGVQP